MNIGIIVGSLRKESYNRKIAKTLIEMAPENVRMEIIEIGQLPLFNEDIENNPPQPWLDFRKQVQSKDAILFCTPEYNRSVPGVLKNAIDVGSRPYGQSSWSKKPVAVASASLGAMGGFGANQHLRQSFVFLDTPCLQQPEVYLSAVQKYFDEQGNLTDDSVKGFLKTFLDRFIDWIKTNTQK